VNEPYLDWLIVILSQETIPQTISTSYGDDEQTVPKDYATTVCNLFAQLGARGVSVLFAAGDGGVGGVQDGSCLSNDGANRMQFIPAFPASCGLFFFPIKNTCDLLDSGLSGPFVTAVGGTSGVNPEVAASFSGGGFSNYFTRPSYQDAAVSTYLNNIGDTYSNLYKCVYWF
jgi:tripeptidyl-peptidase-1